MSNSTKFIRLVTGEDVISDVSEASTDPFITLHEPAKVVYVFEGADHISLKLIPWVFQALTESRVFNVLRRDILLMEDASNTVNDAYSSHKDSKGLEEVSSRPTRTQISKKNLN
jgi:hypothetical protein